MPQHPADGFIASIDHRQNIRGAYAGRDVSWWWLFENVPFSAGATVTRKFRASIVTTVPASTDLYWTHRGSGARTSNPLVTHRPVSSDGLMNIASGAFALNLAYDVATWLTGDWPPTVRVQVEYLDADDNVLNTATLDHIYYDGEKRPQPNAIGGRTFDFNLETPAIQVTPGQSFRIEFNQRFANSSGHLVARTDRAYDGGAWAIWPLDATGNPTSALSAWQPFFRIVEMWDETSAADNGLPRRSVIVGRVAPGISSAGHPFAQWQSSNIPAEYALEIEALANVNFPENTVLRFYKRVRNYLGQQVVLYKDILVATDLEPRLIVPDTVAAFDGGNIPLSVVYGPVAPSANKTVQIDIVDALGNVVMTDKLSIAPNPLTFTPANALTPQVVTLGIASDASANVMGPLSIRYTDGDLTAQTAITVTEPGATGTGLVLSPSTLRLAHGATGTIRAIVNGAIGAAGTIQATSDDPDLTVRIPNSTIPAEGGQVVIEVTAPEASEDADATLTVTLSVGGMTRDTQTAQIRVRADTANLPAAAPGHRYQINGVLQSTDDPEAVSFEMDMAWAGESAFRDGAWRYLPGVIRPSVLTITPDMVIDVERCQIGPDSQDRINAATMQIAQDTSREYLPRRMAKLTLADELALDGHEREIDMGSRAFINNRWQAARTLAVMMRRTRYDALYILRIRPGPSLSRYHVHPGDIVTYTDARYNVYGSRCRVIASTINPDLSVTLSLRQESAAVYQDVPASVLPELPPAGKDQGWQRLFRLPDGYRSDEMAALGNTVALIATDKQTVAGFNIDGTPAGTLRTVNSAARGIEGVTYTAADELATLEDRNFISSHMVIGDLLIRFDSLRWNGARDLAGSRTNQDKFVSANTISYQIGTINRDPDVPSSQRLVRESAVSLNGLFTVALRIDGEILYVRNTDNNSIHADGSRLFGWQPTDENDANATNFIRAIAITAVDEEECLYAIVAIARADNLPSGNYVYRRSDATSPDFPT